MAELEMGVFVFGAYFAARFIKRWYQAAFGAWPSERHNSARLVYGLLPVVYTVLMAYVLLFWASFDVASNPAYLLAYLILGLACVYFGLYLMFACLDISWRDDAVHLRNTGALRTVTGAFLGLTAIYAGSNTGDGPGWWCVLFAGGLGLAAWLAAGWLANVFARVSERITVERSRGCGIRFGCFLLACGIILGRASGGDWTSFGQTVVEFIDGWPLLPLTAIFILVERIYISQSESDREASSAGSYFWGGLYILAAVLCVSLLPPLPQNPLYGMGSTDAMALQGMLRF